MGRAAGRFLALSGGALLDLENVGVTPTQRVATPPTCAGPAEDPALLAALREAEKLAAAFARHKAALAPPPARLRCHARRTFNESRHKAA